MVTLSSERPRPCSSAGASVERVAPYMLSATHVLSQAMPGVMRKQGFMRMAST